MTRRELLAAGAAAACTMASNMWAKSGIDKSRISAITDEIGLSTLEAIAFAHFYGLQNIEIRNPADRGQEGVFPAARSGNQSRRRPLRRRKGSRSPSSIPACSSSPGRAPSRRAGSATKRPRRARNALPARRRAGIAGWKRRNSRSAAPTSWAATRSASSPEPAWPIRPPCTSASPTQLGAISKLAEREKVYFLLENEGSQTVATSQELADVLKLVPSKWIGFNWDPNNAHGMETAYPRRLQRPAQTAHVEPADQGPRHHAANAA